MGDLDRFIQDIFSQQDTFLHSLAFVLAMFVSAIAAWWVFNFVTGKMEKRYGDLAFFEKNDGVFPLVRRAGHYSILILLGTGLLNLMQAPMMERIFYAFLIILLSSMASSLVDIILPYLEQGLAAKTDTHVDDVILDLSKKFSGVIIYATGIILALDVLGLNIMPFVAGAGVAGTGAG